MMQTLKNLLLSVVMFYGFCCVTYAQLSSSSIENMSKNSDAIIAGKVIEQSSNWNETKSRIYTRATISVEENIKGNNSSSVVVLYPGGEVGDIGEMYTHTPKFENNEDVLVFLKKDSKSTEYKVYNGEDGKLTVTTDEKTGEKIIPNKMKLSSIKSQIKSYLKE